MSIENILSEGNMLAVTSIGNIFMNDLPDPEDIRHFFFAYNEKEWSVSGAPDASFVIYGLEGTADKEPYTEQIDARLGVTDHPGLGMFLFYRKTGGGYKDRYYSFGDETKLYEFVEDRIGGKVSKGLFVPPEVAWLAVQDFIEQKGSLSKRIRWVTDDDLPDEAFPEPE